MQAEALELAGQMASASLELHQLIAASESEQEAQLPLMEHAEARLACAVQVYAYAHGACAGEAHACILMSHVIAGDRAADDEADGPRPRGNRPPPIGDLYE